MQHCIHAGGVAFMHRHLLAGVVVEAVNDLQALFLARVQHVHDLVSLVLQGAAADAAGMSRMAAAGVGVLCHWKVLGLEDMANWPGGCDGHKDRRCMRSGARPERVLGCACVQHISGPEAVVRCAQ